jgi:hypothetical protein
VIQFLFADPPSIRFISAPQFIIQKGMGAFQLPCRWICYQLVPLRTPFGVLPHGIGLLGSGGTPQISVAQGGSFGVGIMDSLPCVLAEPPFMQIPV